MLNCELKSLQSWEVYNLIPRAASIKKICDLLDIPLNYFGDYYYQYFDSPEDKVKAWKEKNGYSYVESSNIIGTKVSTLNIFINGKSNLSNELYIKLHRLDIL